MLPFFAGAYGNPSSTHYGVGLKAREAVEQARGQVASLLGCMPTEVIFTAGATEAVNLARDLVNGPPVEVTPTYLAETARRIAAAAAASRVPPSSPSSK